MQPISKETIPPSAAEATLARVTRAMSQSTLREVLGMASRPGVISFAIGLPAEDLFPAAALAETAARLIASDPRALQYAVPYQPLKAQVVELMARRGVTCREEQVFLTSGSQQGMDLFARLLLEPGGQAMIERTVYDGLQMAIKRLEPRILTVPTDVHTGIDVDAVEALLEGGADPAFLYVITDGHNPLGVSVSPEKRRRLVALARRYRMPILEDDAYGFLGYEEAPALPLRALEDEWVFYLGSFSKILAPALRAGWVVVPERLVPTLAALKHAADIDTPNLGHRLISAYLERGELPAHVARLRTEYRRRRDAMLSALERLAPVEVRWNHPASGMFVWLEMPVSVDTSRLVRQAIETEGVAFSPGEAFAAGGSRHANHCLRLAFSCCTPEQIEEGVERLARVMARAIR